MREVHRQKDTDNLSPKKESLLQICILSLKF